MIENMEKVEMPIRELLEKPITSLQRVMAVNQFEQWNHYDQRALIVSIFNKKKIGSIAILTNGDLVDGRQIYTAIRKFYHNGLPYMGKAFEELDEDLKERFLSYKVDCYLEPVETSVNG